MNLFSIVEKLAQDTSAVAFDAAKCARGIDRFSKCDLCVSACPTAAIRLDTRIEFDDKACVSCGMCLHLCPLGAFTGEDRVLDLFNCTPRLPDKRAIQLTCSLHPSPERGPSPSITLRTNGCLASLGASAYLWLLAEGTNQVIVRLDACASCEIGKVSKEIVQTVGHVRSILNTRGQADRVIKIETSREDFKPVDVYDAKEPPLSRRDLFRSVAAQAPKIATQVLPMIDTRPTKGKRPPLERRRLINVLKRLPADDPSQPLASDPIPGIVRKTASSKCTACNACARVCPTGALSLIATESDFRLTYAASVCTDCGACMDVCKPAALERAGMPTLGEFIASEPVVLIAGSLRMCERCGAKFAGDASGNLCSICAFRQQNPFGGVKPEDLALRSRSQT